MKSRLLTIAGLFVLSWSVFAAEQPPLSDAEKIRVIELIKNLGADDFAERRKSVEGLSKMPSGIVPILRETAAKTQDAEVKAQIATLLKKRALESETDPAVLSRYGREEALATNYAEAALYYKKAAKLYDAAAMGESDAIKKKALEECAKKASERSKHAEMIPTVRVENVGDAVVGGDELFLGIGSINGVDVMSDDW
jgi:hypothetical protein